MKIISGRGRWRGLLNESKGRWGSGGGGSGNDEPPHGDQGPWSEPPRRRSGTPPFGNVTSLDDLIRRSRARLGNRPGGGFPGGNRSLLGWAAIVVVLLWL